MQSSAEMGRHRTVHSLRGCLLHRRGSIRGIATRLGGPWEAPRAAEHLAPERVTGVRDTRRAAAREQLGPQHTAIRIARRVTMTIAVYVHTANNPRLPPTWLPFHSHMGRGVAHAIGTANREPIELRLSAQSGPQCPTGTCSTSNIVPPNRIGAFNMVVGCRMEPCRGRLSSADHRILR